MAILSFALFLNLLRWAAGELAFPLVDMAMRQREKATQLAQVLQETVKGAQFVGPLL